MERICPRCGTPYDRQGKVCAECLKGRQKLERGSPFTPRQRQIAELVAQGLVNKDIAVRLCIAPGTVKEYLHKMTRRSGCENRTQIALAFLGENAEEDTLS